MVLINMEKGVTSEQEHQGSKSQMQKIQGKIYSYRAQCNSNYGAAYADLTAEAI